MTEGVNWLDALGQRLNQLVDPDVSRVGGVG
jgi:hypothetical protein